MPHGIHFPDPGLEYGHFRILPRTDGLWIVVDSRRAPGKRTVGKPFRTRDQADQAARVWHEAGHG